MTEASSQGAASERYVCVHGHFYQPPRENPWLEAIELQDSAYPYHDWNERITAECYGPNTASRVLDGEGWITRIVNNYARISFNFGPTLLAWLQQAAPDVYHAVIAADRESAERFSGHGSAIAQAYGHMILPLTNRRDKRTQVAWGVRDFEHRFGRRPEGMWLPETAVDVESLEVLAEQRIAFTILAPHQARRARRIGGRNWRDVTGAQIDPSRAYLARLPSGKRITVFFYDGPISRAVAFEGLLTSGAAFAERLVSGFSDARDWPQLSHIATDGESYGHHHRHGDMALSFALDQIEREGLARLTNYGEFLERHPPAHEVEIYEDTSWSCVHGVERWRSDCGCNSGGQLDWDQAWRAPLRDALDWLRDELAGRYEQQARRFLRDPWAARDAYIDVVLDRAANLQSFLAVQAASELDGGERTTVLMLLELQRHAMLMYTSCGWFFDDLSGIETVQVIQYAGRAIQLAGDLFGDDLESPFLRRLETAKSNVPEHGNGRHVYERFVRPAVVDLPKVGAHYAVSSLFEPYEERAKTYAYRVDRSDFESHEAGRTKLNIGLIAVTSETTLESARLSFGVLHFGDHNVSGGIRPARDDGAHAALVEEVLAAFREADIPAVIRAFDKHFGESTYSLKSLFRDEQRNVLSEILDRALAEVEGSYRQVYEHHATLMAFLAEIGVTSPKALRSAAELVINAELRRLFEEGKDGERAHALIDEAASRQLELDAAGLGLALKQTLDRVAGAARAHASSVRVLAEFQNGVDLARTLPFEVDLWKAQNVYYDMLHATYPKVRTRAEGGDTHAGKLAALYVSLGEKLSIRVE